LSLLLFVVVMKAISRMMSVGQLHHLLYLFLCFEAVSRLKINLSKSEIVLVGDVGNGEGLASILGCRVASLPMKYLGWSFLQGLYIWNVIIEKMEHHLAGCRAIKHYYPSLDVVPISLHMSSSV
jgi:hypothetical protein